MANDNSIVKFGNLKAGVSALWTAIVGKLAGKQDVMQVSALPEPSQSLAGKVVQYVGAANAQQNHNVIPTVGHFYICEQGSSSDYIWSELPIQMVVGGVEQGNSNAVSSGAVYVALTRKVSIATEMPVLDTNDRYLGQVYQYLGVTDSDYIHGHFYECVSDGGTPAHYLWRELVVQTNQVETVPQASEDMEGRIIQYTGTVPSNSAPLLGAPANSFVVGRFYKCVSDGEGGYDWEEVPVQVVTDTIASGSDEAVSSGAVHAALQDCVSKSNFLNTLYPKGSIYITYDNTNPGTWLGGTWELISQGKFIAGVDANDADFAEHKTGGGKDHVATINLEWTDNNYIFQETVSYNSKSLSTRRMVGGGYTSATKSENQGTRVRAKDSSGNLLDNALPPYQTLYVWRRTDDGAIACEFDPLTIAAQINSSSVNTTPAGAKAVYDYHKVEDITDSVTLTPTWGTSVMTLADKQVIKETCGSVQIVKFRVSYRFSNGSFSSGQQVPGFFKISGVPLPATDKSYIVVNCNLVNVTSGNLWNSPIIGKCITRNSTSDVQVHIVSGGSASDLTGWVLTVQGEYVV